MLLICEELISVVVKLMSESLLMLEMVVVSSSRSKVLLETDFEGILGAIFGGGCFDADLYF